MWESYAGLLGATAGGWAAWRAHRTGTATGSPGLASLRWSFAAWGLAALLQVVQAVAYDASLDAGGPAAEGLDVFDALFWLPQVLVILGLAFAAGGYGASPRRSGASAPAALPFMIDAAPWVALAQAVGFLALTGWSALVLARRGHARSFLAPVGYLLLCGAMAGQAAWGTPLGDRPFMVEASWALGLVVLGLGVPRRPAFG